MLRPIRWNTFIRDLFVIQIGFLLYGLALALLIRANLGTSTWLVLEIALADRNRVEVRSGKACHLLRDRAFVVRAAPKPPFIPGYEICGKVIATGSPRDEQWIGKRVAAFSRFGGYAQKCKTPVKALIEIGKEMQAGTACALCTRYTTAWFAVNEMVVTRAGEKALVYAGAGGVGLAITQLLTLRNIQVTAVVGSHQKVPPVKENGVADCVVARNFNEMKSALSDKKFDLIFNAVYGKTMKNDIALLNTGGRLILHGASSRLSGGKGVLGTLWFVFSSGRILPVFLMMRSKSVSGINMLAIGDQRPDLLKTSMENVFRLFHEKKINPLVHEFPVSEISNVHSEMEMRKTTGKLVVRW